ncbi:hypothetical protein EDM57_04225 [Brevibacillus gelatini]|uniref:Uncharacterized protein n=1 Tax=Brevibacillus gelatini TaxID=1655277 RepID=A0A3M8B948_9BACL|nr:hypothetical protein [Brevibacillus gelatini]RNB59355.1 hypothetical protein EDM57_04225 [Brevibacillus gelatini]
MSKEFEFNGYDWSELAECWGIKVDDESLRGYRADERLAKMIVDYMYDNLENPQMIADLRRFIDALCYMGKKYNFPAYPIWKGLKETKNNLTLVNYVGDCLRRLWN